MATLRSRSRVTMTNGGEHSTEAGIESEAYSLKIPALVGKLVELVGVFVTGTVGGVTDERAVRHWVTGQCHPEREAQLRFAYRVALMIAESCSPRIVQGWFKGSNEALADRAPAMVLQEDFSQEAQRAILDAARRLAQ